MFLKGESLLNVVIVGFGKIGRIKASIWSSLGTEVYVYDCNPLLLSDILAAGVKPYKAKTFKGDDFIFDISTPADTHVKALEWAINSSYNLPHAILIEKPVVSSSVELDEFNLLINSFSKYRINDLINVNETYYFSKALALAKGYLKQNEHPPKQIRIELSKNRLFDNDNGRFYDHSLESFGIEAPHLLAIFQELGFDLELLQTVQPDLYIAADRHDNQGFEIMLTYEKTVINLVSYIGDFRRNSSEKDFTDNPAMVRSLSLKYEDSSCNIIFDTVMNGVDPYTSQINIKTGDKQSTKLINDDHLRLYLSQFLNTDRPTDPRIGLNNSFSIATTLIGLKERSVIKQPGKITRKKELIT